MLFVGRANDPLLESIVATVIQELERLGWKDGATATLHQQIAAGVGDLAAAAEALTGLHPGRHYPS